MNKPAGRGLIRAATVLGAAVVMATVFAMPGLATAPDGFTSAVVARGTDQSEGTLVFREGTDVVVARNVFVIGGSSRWAPPPRGGPLPLGPREVTHFSFGGKPLHGHTVN